MAKRITIELTDVEYTELETGLHRFSQQTPEQWFEMQLEVAKIHAKRANQSFDLVEAARNEVKGQHKVRVV